MDYETYAPRYKYVLQINGVSSSWRLHELLRTGSVLVLQEHPTTEWLHSLLTPWVHYVPVDESLEHLIERLLWLRDHDTEAQRIANAAQTLYDQSVHLDAVIDHNNG